MAMSVTFQLLERKMDLKKTSREANHIKLEYSAVAIGDYGGGRLIDDEVVVRHDGLDEPRRKAAFLAGSS